MTVELDLQQYRRSVKEAVIFTPAKDDRIFEVRCSGISPLLMDRWTENDWIHPNQRSPFQRVLEKFYRDPHGYPVIPSRALEACLAEAGRSIRIDDGKMFSSRRLTGYVLCVKPDYARLEFAPSKNPLSQLPSERCEISERCDPSSSWRIDGQRGPGSAGHAYYRIRFDQWSFTFHVQAHSLWINWIGGSEKLQQLFERAGKRVGLLSFNPAHMGPYGRFTLDKIEEIASS